MIVNLEKVNPAPVETGAMEYPGDIVDWIEKNVSSHKLVETGAALKEAGSKKALNIVMLGVLSTYLDFTVDQWEQAMGSLVKPKFLEMNLKAFHLGREL